MSENRDPQDSDVHKQVGDILRNARLAQDKDLPQVGKALKIRQIYLSAIEDSRLQDLPGAAYAVGFVRAYADYLGLDSDHIVAQFKSESNALDSRAKLVFPEPPQASRIPGGALIFVALLLAVLVYAGWWYATYQSPAPGDVAQQAESPDALLAGDDKGEESGASDEMTPVADDAGDSDNSGDTVASDAAAESDSGTAEAQEPAEPEMTEASETAETANAASDGTQTDDNVVETTTDTDIPTTDGTDPSPSPAVESGSGDPDPASAIETVAATQDQFQTGTEPLEFESATDSPARDDDPLSLLASGPEIPSPQIYGLENSDYRILIEARTASWVEVTAADGERILTRLLRSGESFRVPNRPGLLLVTGNAGGLQILVDGQEIPAIGPSGAVRRNVLLEPEWLTSLVADEG